jgi:hypothetical protein
VGVVVVALVVAVEAVAVAADLGAVAAAAPEAHLVMAALAVGAVSLRPPAKRG